MKKSDKTYFKIAFLVLGAAMIYYWFGEIIGEFLKTYFS